MLKVDTKPVIAPQSEFENGVSDSSFELAPSTPDKIPDRCSSLHVLIDRYSSPKSIWVVGASLNDKRIPKLKNAMTEAIAASNRCISDLDGSALVKELKRVDSLINKAIQNLGKNNPAESDLKEIQRDLKENIKKEKEKDIYLRSLNVAAALLNM